MFPSVYGASLPPMKCGPSCKQGGPRNLKTANLLKAAENAGFDVLVTSDQNIRYQQNLAGRKLALVVLGSNIWPIVMTHSAEVAARIDAATPGSQGFIVMPLPPKPRSSK
jgi:hypothetical protein